MHIHVLTVGQSVVTHRELPHPHSLRSTSTSMSSVFVRRKFGQADTTALIHVLCMGVWGLINALLDQSSSEAACSLHYRTQNKEWIERDSLKNPSAWGNTLTTPLLKVSKHSMLYLNLFQATDITKHFHTWHTISKLIYYTCQTISKLIYYTCQIWYC